MKPRFSHQTNRALTLVEVVVIISVLVVLVATLLPANIGSRRKAMRISCVNNLKEIDVADRIWLDGPPDYPTQVSITNGGTMELAEKGIAYVNFQVLSNELITPKILICPADTSRIAATNFTTDFNNTKISYFVGLDAAEEYSQRIISGDDNFEIGGVPVKSGLLELSTNTPIAWTAARHKFVGNIGLADGSVQQVTTDGLQEQLHQTGLATNRLAIP
jgi:hypothetical protein